MGRWVTLDDAALDADIVEAGILRSDQRLRMAARKLFACALETPGGLKVQTIHALCTRLLQQFPFEANVPARFAVMDERDQNEMMERANLEVLLEASREPDSDAGRALNTAMASAADVTFKDVVREACLSRDQFVAWTERAGSVKAAIRAGVGRAGGQPDDTIENVEREIVDGPNLPRSRLEGSRDCPRHRQQIRDGPGNALSEALVFTASEQVERISRVFSYR